MDGSGAGSRSGFLEVQILTGHRYGSGFGFGTLHRTKQNFTGTDIP
jgi:hypothetical protein